MWQTGDVTNFPFKNNVPDPILSGEELPTFKFSLEQSQGKVVGGSCGNCSTVASLPKLPPTTLPCDCSRENLNVGSSSPERIGSGTLFLKGKLVTSPVCHIAGLHYA